MSLFANIFINNVLPAFMVMATGVLLDRALHVDKRSLARLAMYVLTPCLVFSSLSHSEVDPSQFGRMLLFVLAITVVMVLVALAVGRLLHWSRELTDALVLSVAFLNSGNFGLSVVLFTFGDAGLQLGTVFFIGTNLACNTLSAFFASRSKGGTRRALLNVFKLPGLYAFGLALLMRAWHITVPTVILRPTELIGRAMVPVMLMMLGLQLSQTHIGHRYKEVAVGVFLRLVVGALAAIGLAPLIGLQGLAQQVAITQAATPTAVSSALMAIEFESDAEFVTSTIFFSTLFSSVTLTLLLSFLTG